MVSGHAPGSVIVASTLTVTVFAASATFLRVWTRVAIAKNAGVDDAFALVATLLSITMTVSMCLQAHHGTGRHWASLSAHEQRETMRWLYMSIWQYNIALGATKYSILFQYLRIFPQVVFRRWCWTVILVVGIYTAWAALSAIFFCSPVQYFWDFSIKGGHCLDKKTVWFTNAAINIATDVATVILPQPVLSSLNLPNKQRMIMMLIFGLGGATCVISILRLPELAALAKSDDPSYSNPMASIWSNCEVNVGIICSCLPTLKGLVVWLRPGLFTGSNRTASEFSSASNKRRQLHFSNSRSRSANREEHDDDTIFIMHTLRQESEPRASSTLKSSDHV